MTQKIVIVDDHILIAKALTSIIDNFNNFEVLYECENGQQLTERLGQANAKPDIILLDVSMPIMDGFATAAWLKEHHPNIFVMALSMQNDDESLIKMIKSGAHGYLLKNVHPAELEHALTTLVAKGMYYPDWAASKILQSIANPNLPTTNAIHFTEREKEFLQYVTSELTYKEIAEKMFCSPRTVESYRDSLFEKLQLKTRVGLAVYAMKTNVVI
jgi:DNA-binding NarL/FixJ family response regulator